MTRSRVPYFSNILRLKGPYVPQFWPILRKSNEKRQRIPPKDLPSFGFARLKRDSLEAPGVKRILKLSVSIPQRLMIQDDVVDMATFSWVGRGEDEINLVIRDAPLFFDELKLPMSTVGSIE
jgi:hypothetical protein